MAKENAENPGSPTKEEVKEFIMKTGTRQELLELQAVVHKRLGELRHEPQPKEPTPLEKVVTKLAEVVALKEAREDPVAKLAEVLALKEAKEAAREDPVAKLAEVLEKQAKERGRKGRGKGQGKQQKAGE